jgi:3-oxoacyl-[acyl-carrier protein] reductase
MERRVQTYPYIENQNKMPSNNTTVFVTGASRGIGLAIVSSLLGKENEQFNVIGTSRLNPIPVKVAQNPSFEYQKLDLGQPEKLDAFLKKLNKEGWPDVVINNAGISEEAALTESDSKWDKIWKKIQLVNLESPARICKRAIKYWIQNNKKGIIINISSRAAYRGDTPEYAAYAASKGGLVAFTKSISRNLGKKGIVAYSIAPGFVETDMVTESISVYGEDYLKEGLSFNTLTQPEEIAEMVVFLASGKVKHMTGSTFHINGGSYLI